MCSPGKTKDTCIGVRHASSKDAKNSPRTAHCTAVKESKDEPSTLETGHATSSQHGAALSMSMCVWPNHKQSGIGHGFAPPRAMTNTVARGKVELIPSYSINQAGSGPQHAITLSMSMCVRGSLTNTSEIGHGSYPPRALRAQIQPITDEFMNDRCRAHSTPTRQI